LPLLALLLALAAVGAAGWGLWQLRQLQDDRQLQALRAELQTSQQSQRQESENLRLELAQRASLAELNALQQALLQLQGEQQQLGHHLGKVLQSSRDSWRLVEAEHLLRLASLRLAALQDIDSARVLVQAVGETLREQDDADALPAREQVAALLQQLRSTEQPQRSEVFVQLAALREQVTRLVPLAPEFGVSAVPADEGPEMTELGEIERRVAAWLARLSQYFRIQLNADDDIRPLLAGEQLAQVRLALNLALQQAQWAALNAEAPVYAAALTQARQILQDYFRQDNPQSVALRSTLAQLAEQPVSVATPDPGPALAALQAYIERRQALLDGSAASAEAQP
jgi:uroporphyrin-3 C-methyltransferase